MWEVGVGGEEGSNGRIMGTSVIEQQLKKKETIEKKEINEDSRFLV